MTQERREGRPAGPSVFLSYATPDRPTAQLLASRLLDAGIEVWWDTLITPGENWATAIHQRLRVSDYMVVLISAHGLQSDHLHKEILTAKAIQELSDRSITVIPVLLDDIELPEPLRDIQYIDFRSDPRAAVEALVSRFRSTLSTDFSRLSGRQFESLVGDLLVDLGFSVEREAQFHGKVFDYRANFLNFDPFGIPSNEVWFIEVKHYSVGRLSVSSLAEFTGLAQQIRNQSMHCGLITSSQITSAAREMMRSIPIRIIEGVELKRMLLTRPHLVGRYFRTQIS